MNIISEFDCNLFQLGTYAKRLAESSSIGEIYFLRGDLGAGKTTFSRMFINSIFDKYKIQRPQTIKSPSFPVMINYSLIDYEIFHYDFYRIKNINEMAEIDFFENLKKNISIIEWPDIILNNYNFNNYNLIEFKIINLSKRKLKHSIK